MAGSIESAISRVAATTGVNRNALERVIFNESRGNPHIGMNKTNYSAGIAQVSKAVWEKYSKIPFSQATDPKNYEHNMMIGAKYLKENYKKFGNWVDAMKAYNVGPTALQKIKQGNRQLPKTTQNYIKNFKE